MTLNKNINGYIVISDIIDGHWVTRKYMGYTKKEAKRLFENEMKRDKLNKEYYESFDWFWDKEKGEGK
tara:strand:+ start:162 stop:365 length:204 start_codon:yes stop_codon:yes gene_type:complete